MLNLSLISIIVKISGPNRSAKMTDHLTCISANVIYCITSTLSVRRSKTARHGKKLRTTLNREHRRDLENKTAQMRPNQLRSILIFLMTPTTTNFAGYPYSTGERRKNLEQKCIFKLGTLFTHGINERLSSHLLIHSHINLEHPTIPLFALRKG